MLPLRQQQHCAYVYRTSLFNPAHVGWILEVSPVHVRLFLMVVVLAVHMFIYVCVCVCMKDQSEQWRGTFSGLPRHQLSASSPDVFLFFAFSCDSESDGSFLFILFYVHILFFLGGRHLRQGKQLLRKNQLQLARRVSKTLTLIDHPPSVFGRLKREPDATLLSTAEATAAVVSLIQHGRDHMYAQASVSHGALRLIKHLSKY